jgi:ribonucleotide reductase beta subunit family protein with ferritin-like domain
LGFSVKIFITLSHKKYIHKTRKTNMTSEIKNQEEYMSKHTVEPISIQDDSRFCLFPIKNHDVWDLYKRHVQKIWTVEEVDLSEDYKSWKTMNPDEQHFVSVTLAFFANSDNVVLENLATRFTQEICIPEASAFLSIQGFMETVHVETYNLCIDALILDSQKKIDLFKAIETNPIVQPKLEWAIKWIESSKSLAHRLVAFAAVEGIFFASSFASIFWLRKRQKLPGVCFANEKIVEDESLHVRFASMIYKNYIKNKLSTEEVYEIINEAVEIEKRFARESLPVKLIGMNNDLMQQYVCKVADVVLDLLGEKPFYQVKNPFSWMEGLGLVGKSNFFEKRVAEYVKVSNETSIRSSQIHKLGEELDF